MTAVQGLIRLSIASAIIWSFAALAGGTLSAQPAEKAITIAFFGDSLAAGYGLQATDALPAKLAAALKRRGHKIIIVNAGVSGDTAQAGLSRLNWSLPAKLDGVILELGANDALRGINPDQTKKSLTGIITTLRAKKLPVLLVGMRAPPNMGKTYTSSFDAIYPALAKRFGLRFYPFILADVAAQPHLNQPDGIHPNVKGVEIIVGNMIPVVEKFLGDIARLD